MACDGCGKVAKTRGYRMAPEGWLYLPAFDSDPASVEEGCEFIVMLACSVECAGKLWRPGPGPQLDQVRADRRLELERRETEKDPLARSWGKMSPQQKEAYTQEVYRKGALEGLSGVRVELRNAIFLLSERPRKTAAQRKTLAELEAKHAEIKALFTRIKNLW